MPVAMTGCGGLKLHCWSRELEGRVLSCKGVKRKKKGQSSDGCDESETGICYSKDKVQGGKKCLIIILIHILYQ